MRLVRLALICVAAVCGLTACSNEDAKRRHLANGDRLVQAGQLPDAIIEYRNAVRLDERWGEARFKLAEAYAAAGDGEHAYREYIRAADLLPADTAAQLKAATYLLLVQQYDDARARAHRVLERDPSNADALVVLGNALAGLNDLDGAVAQITEAIALEPSRGQSYTNLGMLQIAQGRRDEARASFEKAVAIEPASIGAWLALGNYQWSVGDINGAEQSLTKAYSLDERHILTNRALATLYASSGREARAERYLQLVAEIAKTPAARLALADYYIATRRPADARAILERLAAEPAAFSGAALRLAAMAYVDGDRQAAHGRVDAVLARDAHDADALLLKARWLLAEGRRERALQTASAAVAANPRLTVAHYVRGLAESSTHRSSDALKSFTEVLRLNPRAIVAKVHVSRLHLARNSIDSAVSAAEEAVRSAPASLDARLALVRAWVARDDFARAREDLKLLKTQAPDVAEVHAIDGSLQLLASHTAQARAAFARALQLDPAWFEAVEGLTRLDMHEGRTAAAHGHVERALAAEPDHPDLLLLAGKLFIADGDLTKAERALRRAIELDPLGIDPFRLLGQIYASQGRLEAVRQELDDAARGSNKNVPARILAAMIVHAQGNLTDAIRRYTEIVALEPRAALAANNLAAIYAEQGERLDVALQLAESASDQLPAHPEILDTLGWVYYSRRAYGPAIVRFEQSIALDARNPHSHHHLGLALSKTGDIERAEKAFDAALALDPTFHEARTARASLKK